MRGLATAFLAVLGVVTFCGAFAATSVLTYVASPTAMTATARQSDAHGVMLDVVDRVLEGELEQGIEPAFEGYVLSRARGAVRAAAPEAWLYGMLTQAFQDVTDIVIRGGDVETIYLGQMRSDLRKELMAVGEQVRADCVGLTNSPACADAEVLAELIQVYQRAVTQVTEGIPAETDLRTLVAASGTDRLAPDSPAVERARQAHRWGTIARWGCLGLFVLIMLLIAWINHAPLSRLLAVLGVVAVLSAGTYLLVAHFADDLAAAAMRRAPVGEGLDIGEQTREAGHGQVGPVITAGAERLALRAARDALGISAPPAIILLAAGIGAIAGGLLLRRGPAARSR